MRAIGTKSRSLDTLSLVDIPQPEPGHGEVRVDVHAATVNPADLLTVPRQGAAFVLHAKVSPHVPGYDFSGVVDAIGSGVTDLDLGDAVFGHLAYSGKTRQGTFAEQLTIRADEVAKKPDAVSHEKAAALPTAASTALQALRDKGGLKKGQRVLVIGASGGVGSFAVSVGKRLGAHVTGICSTYAIDYVRELGADDVVDRKRQDPLVHDTPFDVIFDTTGSYAYSACQKILTDSGVFVTTLPSASFAWGKVLTLFSARSLQFLTVMSRRRDLELLATWASDGMTVPIAETYAVSAAKEALARLKKGGLLGKVAIDVLDRFEG